MEAVEPFLSLVIYPTTPEAQAQHADNLVRMVGETVRLLPGFLRGRVFLAEDGGSLVTIVEWSDRESFERFRQTDFGRAATQLLAGLHPKAYWLRHHAAVDAP